jgi:hypothetical protein
LPIVTEPLVVRPSAISIAPGEVPSRYSKLVALDVVQLNVALPDIVEFGAGLTMSTEEGAWITVEIWLPKVNVPVRLWPVLLL